MRKIFALVMILAFTLAACGQASGGATVRIGWAGSPDTLNPGAAILTEAYTIFELVYDSMYELNLDGSYTLSLAESVNRSSDDLTYTYKLRKGVKFHDGNR